MIILKILEAKILLELNNIYNFKLLKKCFNQICVLIGIKVEGKEI